jgi:hypothetical protein
VGDILHTSWESKYYRERGDSSDGIYLLKIMGRAGRLSTQFKQKTMFLKMQTRAM